MKKNSNKQKNICIFSGKRGGFGAYLPLMKMIQKDRDLRLQILLSDMHSSGKFGNTANEVRHFFPIADIEIIKMDFGKDDSPLSRVENLGVCLSRSARVLDKLKPDIIMVHGDRGEHLVIALAAQNLGITVAHTQGGEISGNIDDIQRHAITKLSHLHFPETALAAERIKNIGEEPWRINVAGSIYIDRIVKKMYTPFSEVHKKYGLDKNEKYFIVIYHPDTFESKKKNYENMKNIISAVKFFGYRTFVIYPCSDPGHDGILKAINEEKANKQLLVYKNVDNLDFLGLLEKCQALIGNSSCALVEAPYFKLPAINIGKRQMGRDRENNVIDAKPSADDIIKKIKFVLGSKNFRKKLAKCGTRAGDGKASERIVKILKKTPLDIILLRKRYYN